METTANLRKSIPSFKAYVEDRKYLKNVSPKTLSWFKDAWKAFGPYLEPVWATGGRLSEALSRAERKPLLPTLAGLRRGSGLLGPFGRPLLFAGLQPVAAAVHFQNVNVMGQPKISKA